MDLEKVVIISEEKDVMRIERVIDSISQINKSLILGKIIYGRVGKDMLLSFNTDKRYYRFMLEKLRLNNVKVLVKQNEVDEEKLMRYKRKGNGVENKGWDDLKKRGKNPLHVETMVAEGRYQDILKAIKDIRTDQKNAEEARIKLPEAIIVAIEKAKREFNESATKQEDSIKKLIEIASDSNLKYPQYSELTKNAILAAIDLSSQLTDQLYKLINICNNNQVHHIGPVKAAIMFASFIMEKPDLFDSDIQFAVKKLNRRWLMICYPLVEHELELKEKEQFNSFYDYISALKN